MTELVAHIGGGLLLGLAGGLHCACMCGGLTSVTLNLFSFRSRKEGMVTLGMITAGRISAYAVLGALAAGGAGLASELMAIPAPSKVMALFAALALMGIGFSTAGLLPAGSGLATRMLNSVPGIGVTDAVLTAVRAKVLSLGPFTIGLSWGVAPCPLLYAALFLAMLIGTPLGGMVWMIGFGLGTVPAVLASALGLHVLKSLTVRAHARIAIGLSIVAFGFATIYFDLGIFEALCRRP